MPKTSVHRSINFNAGPSTLPESVLEEAQTHLLNYHGTGLSVMEMSHRSPEFESILNELTQDLKDVLAIPSNYDVLCLQGGASQQFAMIPMNLVLAHQQANLIQTGSWTKKAHAEIEKICKTTIIASGEPHQFLKLPEIDTVMPTSDASFVYMCSNNTIYGTQFTTFPTLHEVPLIADMSSDILSRQLDISQFGLIFAGAQKNIGPSGVTLVIIRKDLVERCQPNVSTIFQYRTHVKNSSLYNTPPTFGIYLAGLNLKWIKKQGGLSVIEQKNTIKATLLYDYIDNSDIFYSPIHKNSRSNMNCVFRIRDNNVALENTLLSETHAAKIIGLKGHRSIGGLRASLYNAQTLTHVEALIEFLDTFSKKHN